MHYQRFENEHYPIDYEMDHAISIVTVPRQPDNCTNWTYYI